MLMKTNKSFRLVLIKPSHYDNDGYVIRWWRGGLPSNSLACLYGIALECRERQVLGADFDIDIEAIDETNWKVRVEDLTRSIKAADAGMVMLVGVQSNQFPRSLDIAKQFRRRGIQVAIGGFHVSGTLSMLPERDPSVQEMMDLGVSVFAGEAEGRLEGLLQDAVAGKLQPLYNFLGDLPHLEGQPLPIIPRQQIQRVTGHTTSFDAGRGCPFQCSFCTIINVRGRKSRRRTADDIEAVIRGNVAQGIYGFFIFVMTAVMLVLVLGVADNADPLTIFSTFITKIFGAEGGWVQWVIGLPLVGALLLSVLNAIMGCARSLYQTSEDGTLPRWFGHLNRHGVPDRAMAFNVVCSILVLLFGSPLRIYIFSNIGYLFACMMGFFAYFVHRQTRPSIERPYRLPGFMRWVALAVGIVCAVLLIFGGWNSASVVLGTTDHALFLLGVLVLAAYVPLHLWRRFTDRRRGGETPPPADETPPAELPAVAQPAAQA